VYNDNKIIKMYLEMIVARVVRALPESCEAERLRKEYAQIIDFGGGKRIAAIWGPFSRWVLEEKTYETEYASAFALYMKEHRHEAVLTYSVDACMMRDGQYTGETSGSVEYDACGYAASCARKAAFLAHAIKLHECAEQAG